MMELGEEVNVKALRARFLNEESSRLRMKPVIPEKPKTIPSISPTAKISNPLLASINSAVENRLAPRVIFRDDKKTHPLSQPETSEVKAKPILLDKNQKREADLIKQALKNKKILPTSPVMPDLERKPRSDSIQKSPGLEMLVKVPTPFRTALNNTYKDEKEKTFQLEDVPAFSFLDHSDSSISTQAKAGESFNRPVVPEALVPPIRTNPPMSAPVIFSPTVSPLKSPALTVPEPVSRNGLQTNNPRPEIPVRLNSNVKNPKADIFSDVLPEESPYIFDMVIPPPIIPEDFSDGGTSSYLDISPKVIPKPSFPQDSLCVTPTSRSPALSCTAFPIQAIETPDSNSVFTFSPPPARLSPSLYIKSMAENRVTESSKATSHMEKPFEVPLPSSPMAATVASALARAEEMAPVKHNACDQRLLNLLEKSKQKAAIGTPSTRDILPLFETDMHNNLPLDLSPVETAHAKPVSHVDAPNAPKSPINLSNILPVNYKGKADKVTVTTDYNTLPHETALNNQEHIHSLEKSSPALKTLVVQRPLVPPPPPPRKPQPTVTNGGLTPEKLPPTQSEDKKPTILPRLPPEYNEPIIQAPANCTSEDTTFEGPSETVGSQNETSYYASVHKKEPFQHLDLKHQTPNIDTTDTGFPRTLTPEYSGSAPNSVFSSALPSPTGKQMYYSSSELEDLATKKTKAQKKQRKGSPMNPYADASVVTDEIPKKTLFSKNNLESDDKELKLKEKQKQRDKEKEKEKDKKDQKDKKKEQKEKEKEMKELKEKEKKENEIRKKFRITGEEEALYQAKVIETTRGRKDDLAIKSGDIVSIIRTTDCPKGKWLARDNTNKYGYIPVESVEMNIPEMMVLGNKAKVNNRPNINGIINPRTPSTDVISTHNYSMNQESFEDDSEEWGDDDDTVFPKVHTTNILQNQQMASPVIGSTTDLGLPAPSDSSDNVYAGRDAVHKLTTFFAQPTVPILQNNTPIKEPAPLAISSQEPVNVLKQEVDLQILPPPDLYADIVVG